MARPGRLTIRWTHLPLAPGAPVRVVGARVAHPRGGDPITTLGAGRTEAEARRRARAEAIERLSGFLQGSEPRVRASLAALGPAAIHPNDVLLYSRRQVELGVDRGRRLAEFDPARRMDWTPLRSLSGGRSRFLPTRLVYYGCPSHPGSAFGRADSNGVAAGRTAEDATLRALLELIERDAVALWWYRRLRRPAVAPSLWRATGAERIRRWFEARGRWMWALDLTTDIGVPVVAAISRRPNAGGDGIRLGFGAALDRRAALERAVAEVAQLTAVGRAARDGAVRLPADLARWLRDVTLANEPELVAHRGAASPARVRPTGLASGDLAQVVRRLGRVGLEAFRVDLTRPEFGLPVVRVVVPGLRPWWPRFGPGRLYDGPVAAGWTGRAGAEHQLNRRALPF